MPMLRTVKCDICKCTETEKDYGVGWKGWAIIQGIAAKKPIPGEKLTNENMTSTYCPKCAGEIAGFITNKQSEFKTKLNLV